jgi:hypothetical protein
MSEVHTLQPGSLGERPFICDSLPLVYFDVAVLFVELTNGKQFPGKMVTGRKANIVKIQRNAPQATAVVQIENAERISSRRVEVHINCNKPHRGMYAPQDGLADVANNEMRIRSKAGSQGSDVHRKIASLPEIRMVAVVERLRHPAARIETDCLDANPGFLRNKGGIFLKHQESSTTSNANFEDADFGDSISPGLISGGQHASEVLRARECIPQGFGSQRARKTPNAQFAEQSDRGFPKDSGKHCVLQGRQEHTHGVP